MDLWNQRPALSMYNMKDNYEKKKEFYREEYSKIPSQSPSLPTSKGSWSSGKAP